MKNLFFLLFLSLSFLTSAQNPGDVAQNFGKDPGFMGGDIQEITVQADGKILVGGNFTIYNGSFEGSIIRLNPDFTKDTTFGTGTGFNNTVTQITMQADGKILVVGWFTTYKNTPENRIIRLNPDGSKDTSFNTGTGFDNEVHAIKVQADGKILVAGNFTNYNGTASNRIIRLNTDGSKDSSFNTGTFNDGALEIIEQADGKILVGGYFTTYNGATVNYIIRLNPDGSKDTSFNTGTGFDRHLFVIVAQADGKILVGGDFHNYNGSTQKNIIRLNPDGSKDASFDIGTGLNGFVIAITKQADGKILVGGVFTTYRGATVNNIIRLNTDGSKDITFSTGTGFSSLVGTTHVAAIKVQSDGRILTGGDFFNYNGSAANYFIRLDANGSKNTIFSTGTGFRSGTVYKITAQNDGKILVGGYFATYNGNTENSIIRFNPDLTKDTSFGIGTGFNDTVSAITVQADGKILVGGSFTTYNGTAANRIIRLNTDGSKDTSFSTGSGFDNEVQALTLQSDGKILVCALFTTYMGVTENRMIRLNTDGSKDTSFNTGTGFNSSAVKIVVQTDGKLLVGGWFTTYNGTAKNRLIRLNPNGSIDPSFNIGTGFDGFVRGMTVQADGKILVGGGFTTYKGATENRIIRLNPDGSKDSSFSIGTGFNNAVREIVFQADGKIIVGGYFTTYNETTENNIIRLNTNGSKDTSFSTGTGFSLYGGLAPSNVNAIKVKADGKILVGGSFSTYKDDDSSPVLIALHSETSLGTQSFTDSSALTIYPNPVNDIINISFPNETINQINIYDITGRLQKSKNGSSENEKIDIQDLPNAMYLVKVKTEKGSKIVKIVKQ